MSKECEVFNILRVAATLQALIIGCAIVAALLGFFKPTTYGQIIEATILLWIVSTSLFYFDSRYYECVKSDCIFRREIGEL